MADSQKFIARNRAPRVQIEYDVELYGAEKKVQLPFVMGVLSDLSGKSDVSQPGIADRKFLEIDVDTFDDRMRAMAPRAAFTVPNTLTGDGNLAVDLTFESMDDFAPAAIAAKVEPLRALLEARTQLSNLLTYMDGKTGAESLIEQVLSDRALLSTLAATPAPAPDNRAALLSRLRDMAPVAVDDAPDTTAQTLRALAAAAPSEASLPDETASTLAALAASAPVAVLDTDDTAATLAALAASAPDGAAKADDGSAILAALAASAPSEPSMSDETASTLAALAASAPLAASDPDDTAATLAALVASAPDGAAKADDGSAILAALAASAPSEASLPDETASVLSALAASGPVAAAGTEDTASILAGLAATVPDGEPETDEMSAILVAPEVDLLDAPMADVAVESAPAAEPATGNDDLLGDLLADFGDDAAPEVDPLDDLMADVSVEPSPGEDTVTTNSLEDLLGDLDGPLSTHPDPLDDLMASLDDGDAKAASEAKAKDAPPDPFGTLSAPHPSPDQLQRRVFRMAFLGDFSGRSARGKFEIGAALANRRPIPFDIDTAEDVIEGLATTLVLPIGQNGTGIQVQLGGLDDLHPDELYANVDLFSHLSALRKRLSGSMADSAIREMTGWAQGHTDPARATLRASAGGAIPADRRLSDLQVLIGDTEGRLRQPAATDDLIARIVGPHVVASPHPEAAAYKAALDIALSDAMRLVLHHPEFQQVESLWRSLDLMARRIETDDRLEIVLYDISAEEFAADLAAQDDLANSGLFGMLVDTPLSEGGAGGFSAIFGLYSFEETPPHAQLLARMARISAHIEAPFFAAMSPAFMETAIQDRHPLVAQAWNALREMPEARYLGMAAPRFLLRRPYGKRTEPIDSFQFEEFTVTEGVSGMLWGNPVVAVAILLAQAAKKGGAKMQLGQIMTLGEMPFHYVTDRYGDQVALPCTERNLTTTRMEGVVARGFMPLVSLRGRDQIRLASFQSIGGGEILGPWSSETLVRTTPSQPAPTLTAVLPASATLSDADGAGAADDDLDALLAGFGNDAPTPSDPEAMDPELAALLEGL
jgi:pilus assembly protein FimV